MLYIQKEIDSLKNKIKDIPFSSTDIDEEKEELREKLENSFYEFIKYFYPVLEGKDNFQDGMHIKAIADHLEECYAGNIRTLIINIPPGFMKTFICSIMFPAWCWTKDCSLKFFHLSYSADLSYDQSTKCRLLIRSEEYQELWGDRFFIRRDSDAKKLFSNNKGGYRVTSSITGAITGYRGNFVILDDPNNAKQADSEVIRESTNITFDSSITSRFNDMAKYCLVLIQQRVHENDVTGHILSKNDPDVVHLYLPMEFEVERRCITIPLKNTNGKRWRDPRKKEGELLWPERLNKEELEKLKLRYNNPYLVAGQLQQRPSPSEGGIILKSWFKIWPYPELPTCEYIMQSWDTAFTRPTSKAQEANISYSACTTWGIFKDEHDVPNVILLSLYRDKIEYPELRWMAQRLARNYHDTDLDNPMLERYHASPNVVLVEAKASGLPLIADLHRAGVLVTPFDPNKYGNKVSRARLVTPLIESGRVWMQCDLKNKNIPGSMEELFIESAASFPNLDSNDLIDTMSQAFIRLSEGRWLGHPLDPQPPVINPWKNYGKKLYDGRL